MAKKSNLMKEDFLSSGKPWPGMLRGVWGNQEKIQANNTSKVSPVYTNQVTEHAEMKTAISGSWAA